MAFKGKIKTPQELVKKTKEAIEKLDGKKKNEEVGKMLQVFTQALAEGETAGDMLAQLSQEVYSSNLLHLFVSHLDKCEFEDRKAIGAIFGKLLKREVAMRNPTVDYIASSGNEKIVFELVSSYENADIALVSGAMLRDCVRFEPLARLVLLKQECFDKLVQYVQLPSFDISMDAFATFKEILTKHKILAADYLEKNYDHFFQQYDALLNSENYVTRRQSLKLLGELLLDRANFTIMTKYIGNPDNLKLMMNMLRDKSKNIQFEAFHVFKVFVANPSKSKPILEILFKNKEKLVDYLGKFHNDRSEDEQFNEEKQFLVSQIKDIKL